MASSPHVEQKNPSKQVVSITYTLQKILAAVSSESL